MSEYLFSYGTLLPEYAPAEIAAAVSKLRSVGRGTVRGVLYDLGDYPGAILDATSDKRILGTVFRLPNNSAILTQLDEYEGFHPSTPRKSLFVRKRCPVRLSTGRIVDCWIYEYNGADVAAPVVASGQYRVRRALTR